jgi:hypothetical protein
MVWVAFLTCYTVLRGDCPGHMTAPPGQVVCLLRRPFRQSVWLRGFLPQEHQSRCVGNRMLCSRRAQNDMREWCRLETAVGSGKSRSDGSSDASFKPKSQFRFNAPRAPAVAIRPVREIRWSVISPDIRPSKGIVTASYTMPMEDTTLFSRCDDSGGMPRAAFDAAAMRMH